MSRRTAPIPAPHAQPFQAGIQHPDLWLWDSWTLQGVEGSLHLYCLALSQTGFDGSLILPGQRNALAALLPPIELPMPLSH